MDGWDINRERYWIITMKIRIVNIRNFSKCLYIWEKISTNKDDISSFIRCYEFQEIWVDRSDFSLYRSILEFLILDSDGILVSSFIGSCIDLDNAIDLRIEPFYQNCITGMSIGYCDNASFSSVGREFTKVDGMSISEIDEFFDSLFDGLMSISGYLIERVFLQISEITMRFEEGSRDTVDSRCCLMHHPEFTQGMEYMYIFPENYLCKRSQQIDIWVWVSDDDMFISFAKKTLQAEESGSGTGRMRISI